MDVENVSAEVVFEVETLGLRSEVANHDADGEGDGEDHGKGGALIEACGSGNGQRSQHHNQSRDEGAEEQIPCGEAGNKNGHRDAGKERMAEAADYNYCLE